MKQEEKELLLADLCARLPYKVQALYYGAEEECECWDEVYGIVNDYVEIGQYSLPIEAVKPYLFPLSSMTEEQKKEYNLECKKDLKILSEAVLNRTYTKTRIATPLYYGIDWLNKNNFDYRGLIEKGIAINATGLNIY